MTLLPYVQELKDLQKDPPTSCSAGEYTVPCVMFLLCHFPGRDAKYLWGKHSAPPLLRHSASLMHTR